MILSDIEKNSQFEIITIDNPELRERLIEMGFCQGVKGRLLQRLPFGGPLVLQAGTCTFALRKEDATCIHIQKI